MQFTREHLRKILHFPSQDEICGDEAAPASPRLPAAVLIGLVDRMDGPTVLLTKRTDHLKDHAGQICFPGGRIEPKDATIEAAALREAEEEIGLDPKKVDLIQRLAPYDTTTGFRIHPVVGWIEPPFDITPDDFEVAEIFELPLSFILDPANHQRQSHIRNNQRRSYYVLPYQGRFIWGATAGMLVNFSRLLTVQAPSPQAP
ncbi:MAG: CoA pyrophosphatase [Pseudomonadota bacterium]